MALAIIEHMGANNVKKLSFVGFANAEDWDRANTGFIADDPLGGTRASARAGEEDFAQIFSRLVAAAPAPIGLGAGPYKG